MNKLIIGIVVLVIAGAIVFLMAGQSGKTPTIQPNTTTQTQTQTDVTPATTGNAVTIQNMAFAPATITVKAGDTVTWTNQDGVGHSATADDNSFDTGVLDQGKSGSATFSKAGTFTYHCSIHPNMNGVVIVTP